MSRCKMFIHSNHVTWYTEDHNKIFIIIKESFCEFHHHEQPDVYWISSDVWRVPRKLHLSLSLSSSLSLCQGAAHTSSPSHLILFSTLLCILSSSSSLSLLLPSYHLSKHSDPISVLASLVSSCPPHVTLLLSSIVSHPASFLRVLPTVICSSPVSLSSSSVLPSLPLIPPFFSFLPSLLLLFFVPRCFRTHAAFFFYNVVFRSVPKFPFRTGMPVSHKCL